MSSLPMQRQDERESMLVWVNQIHGPPGEVKGKLVPVGVRYFPHDDTTHPRLAAGHWASIAEDSFSIAEDSFFQTWTRPRR